MQNIDLFFTWQKQFLERETLNGILHEIDNRHMIHNEKYYTQFYHPALKLTNYGAEHYSRGY
jgi:hypothetical protein